MLNESKLIINLLNDQAKAPTREPESVGYDIYAFGEHVISPGETKIIPLGFAMAIPEGYGAFIWDRSSYGSRGIHVFRELVVQNNKDDTFDLVTFGGVIDWSYRGQMGVILHSFLKDIYVIKHQTKIAQFVIQKCEDFEIENVSKEDYDSLSTLRGSKGFGSSDEQTDTQEAAKRILDSDFFMKKD